ncbi:MAG: S-methyl-5-thioribose-1-phosphate isomerase [Thermodesulfobacteriota bacterium]|nr:S-methyl-5-thioribose-1-phosphate isomerase [Thermodesulfobacteriota bacterium]
MDHHIQFLEQKDALILLDQRYLPLNEDWFECKTVKDVIYALKTMVVRGAPAIGVTAAYGCYLGAKEVQAQKEVQAGAPFRPALEKLLAELSKARPTAVNLRWAVGLMRDAWDKSPDLDIAGLSALWLGMAQKIHAQDQEINRAMGRYGADLIDDGDTVMTHCNAGALATGGYGTALGVIRAAVEQGKKISVIANETRPFLQGARLTAYELAKDNIPVRVACDNAAGLLMRKGMVQKIVVGADRIAANGDAANKIGTYGVALLAKAHNIPFYVAAPLSTIDLSTPTGSEIPIEERPVEEVTHVGGVRITPEGVGVFNFAFDVTPSELIAGIITEEGVLLPPYKESIQKAFQSAGAK